eukprot:TRINITY_DN2865_c0_g1_i1.p1 TRINITY_DN2865_c0_g1~~TRINITY_DN2865_c0_g1_i1.p1  ORF type:complete len:254 (+),score=41.65 TRINITY_DN2865_c0_g1_i1:74-835(+)
MTERTGSLNRHESSGESERGESKSATATRAVVMKVVIIGDAGAGKSSMLLRFAENSFDENTVITSQIDFKTKTIQIKGEDIALQIWDTAGQEKFRAITSSYFKGVVGVIVAYDLSDAHGTEALQEWFDYVARQGLSVKAKMLVANKLDVASDQRAISTEAGEALAKQFNVPFMEVSAKTGQGIDACFAHLAADIVKARRKSDIFVQKQQRRQSTINFNIHAEVSAGSSEGLSRSTTHGGSPNNSNKKKKRCNI